MVVMKLRFQITAFLKSVSRIIQFRFIGIGNYPRGKAGRNNKGRQNPALKYNFFLINLTTNETSLFFILHA